jgi:signal transduction histidine kinase
MSLKISREDISWSRCRRALPVFLLLFSGGFLLAFCYLLIIGFHLHSIERQETERLLDSYLSAQSWLGTSPGDPVLQQQFLPRDLSFVRFVRHDEQLLVLGEQGQQLSFSNLAGFSADTVGVWLQLGDKQQKDPQIVTVITRSFDQGYHVQAGKDGRLRYGIFRGLVINTLFGLLGSIFVLWPLSLYFSKLSLSPLVSSRIKIAELLESPRSGLLPEKGSGPEMDALYHQINLLIRHNRHLVAEMQQSLDNVAHDLRTPMTRLRSVAEYGLQGGDDIERLSEALSDCLEESERVLAMLGIMMSVAEAESKTMNLALKPCDLCSSLRQVMTLYEYVAEEKKIAVELQAADSITALVDETRIGQVWANLLDNAIKYGRENGWVRISVRMVKERVEVVIEDNGMGISQNEQPRIWERLYRGDRSRSQQGLGLGLNYAQAVVNAHGGTISVDSVLHQGSCFTVILPVNEAISGMDAGKITDQG